MNALVVPDRRPCRAESELWRLPPDGTAARLLRSRVSGQLCDWCLSELGPDLALIASELAGNAVRYGHPPYWANLHMLTDPGRPESVRLIVADVGPGFDVADVVDSWRLSGTMDRGRGRGLLLVDALADSWGTAARAPFCLTWADLATPR
ncbi:anti-sigma regulatory factor (Ser/Thr protein kinase) [Kitasatospora herbaricolor]|uniref:ATP-binding protein n=1 Tax=Kitasatospora herbaricolor TaxID=68217 RepID=UPI00174BEAD6|nr:ATP-binding protein [Kitasatospora herbaricolor]MDQ0313100.1 anti-sigma regulatory factor (Ser/Thr protein kinase) [Kitasatospora herbaricolor]